MDLPIYTVDSFTNKPFAGNPAGVCLIKYDQTVDDSLLQKIASEMNISETSYVQPLSADKDFSQADNFRLRWFTPTNEVDLCGHATLAAAAVLFWKEGNKSMTITFHSNSGPLLARRAGSTIMLDFPLNPVLPHDREAVMPTIKAICDPSLVTDVQISKKTGNLLLHINDSVSRETFEAISPDFPSLHKSDSTGVIRGVIITMQGKGGESGYDFLSRYFAPWNGIPEDPVTGSAHTVLVDYWQKKQGKTSFKARQCSKRGGEVWAAIVGDRVELTGHASVVLSGKLHNVTG